MAVVEMRFCSNQLCLEDNTERSESNLGRSLGLLSLRSVLASRQSYQQPDNKTTRQQDNLLIFP